MKKNIRVDGFRALESGEALALFKQVHFDSWITIFREFPEANKYFLTNLPYILQREIKNALSKMERAAEIGCAITELERAACALSLLSLLGKTPLMTGWPSFDKMTGGLKPGTLTVIGGRPNMGKSSMAGTLIVKTAWGKKKRVVAFCSEKRILEFSRQLMAQLDDETLSTMQIDWTKNCTKYILTLLAKNNIFIDDTGAACMADLFAKCEAAAKKHGNIDLIVIDYIQLLRKDRYSSAAREVEFYSIGGFLRKMARALCSPVIVMVDYAEIAEDRENKRPMLSDLRYGAGPLDIEADLIVLLYIEEYNVSCSERPKVMELAIAKNRGGPVGTVYINYEPCCCGLIFGEQL